MGQGQPTVIIWTILVVLPYMMLHTMFQGHWSIDSREEDFLKVITIYGHGGHLGHMTRTVWTIFRSPDPWRLHMKFGYNRPSSFRGEVVWNCWRTTDDDGACLYYKLPWSLRLRWAKNGLLVKNSHVSDKKQGTEWKKIQSFLTSYKTASRRQRGILCTHKIYRVYRVVVIRGCFHPFRYFVSHYRKYGFWPYLRLLCIPRPRERQMPVFRAILKIEI